MTKIQTKGFTLIELLIVIGIIAVLAVVVLLTLNPAELLRQARDSNRVSDIGSLKSALALYLADQISPQIGDGNNCYVSLPSPTWWSGVTAKTCGNRFSAGSATSSEIATTSRATDGTGWVPVNFQSISSGSPLSVLPIDPSNVTSTSEASSYYYAYKPGPSTCTNAARDCNVYEVNANMESVKFSNGGGSDVESTDGGNSNNLFEVGTDPGLDL